VIGFFSKAFPDMGKIESLNMAMSGMSLRLTGPGLDFLFVPKIRLSTLEEPVTINGFMMDVGSILQIPILR
jgi:hypothetical protein